MVSTNVKFLKKVLFIVDFLIILISCFAVINFTKADNLFYNLCFFECGFIFFFEMFDMYSFKRKQPREDVVSVCLSGIIVLVLYCIVTLILGNFKDNISNGLIISASSILFISIWRYIFDKIYIESINSRKTLIIESKDRPSRLARKIKYSFNNTDNITYYLIDENSKDDIDFIYSCIGGECDEVIILDGLSENFKEELMNYALCNNKRISITETFTKASLYNGYIKMYQDTPMVSSAPITINKAQLALKRVFDIVFSLVGIVISSPFLAVCAIAIKLDSEGPVIYKQERYTIGKKVFGNVNKSAVEIYPKFLKLL